MMVLFKKTAKEIDVLYRRMSMEELIEQVDLLKEDTRKSVIKLGQKYEKKLEKMKKEKARLECLMAFDIELSNGRISAGIDEVGRGPLAGPVVAAAVILPSDFIHEGVNDSKKIPEKRREELFKIIEKEAVAVGIGVITNERIDEINILNATKEAMMMAIANLSKKPELLLIDAVKLDDIDIEQESIIKGDEQSMSIAAASIVAKVTRDRMMVEYAKDYPHYDFENNKGYGTAKHYKGLEEYGTTEIHRYSFLKSFFGE